MVESTCTVSTGRQGRSGVVDFALLCRRRRRRRCSPCSCLETFVWYATCTRFCYLLFRCPISNNTPSVGTACLTALGVSKCNCTRTHRLLLCIPSARRACPVSRVVRNPLYRVARLHPIIIGPHTAFLVAHAAAAVSHIPYPPVSSSTCCFTSHIPYRDVLLYLPFDPPRSLCFPSPSGALRVVGYSAVVSIRYAE